MNNLQALEKIAELAKAEASVKFVDGLKLADDILEVLEQVGFKFFEDYYAEGYAKLTFTSPREENMPYNETTH